MVTSLGFDHTNTSSLVTLFPRTFTMASSPDLQEGQQAFALSARSLDSRFDSSLSNSREFFTDRRLASIFAREASSRRFSALRTAISTRRQREGAASRALETDGILGRRIFLRFRGCRLRPVRYFGGFRHRQVREVTIGFHRSLRCAGNTHPRVESFIGRILKFPSRRPCCRERGPSRNTRFTRSRKP